MGKKSIILAGLVGNSDTLATARQGDLSVERMVPTSNRFLSEEYTEEGICVRQTDYQPTLNGYKIFGMTSRRIGDKTVLELRDDFQIMDRMHIPYVGKYCMMNKGRFARFMTLEDGLAFSHKNIIPGTKEFGYAEGAIILGMCEIERTIKQLFCFFVGQKVYITDSRWFANQLAGNSVFAKEFVFVDGSPHHLAGREDYGDGDEIIVDPDLEPEDE